LRVNIKPKLEQLEKFEKPRAALKMAVKKSRKRLLNQKIKFKNNPNF